MEHANQNKTPANRTGCMSASQMELLWNVSVDIERQAQALLGQSGYGGGLNLTELQASFSVAPYRTC